jgi:hypothetical protein
MRIDSEPVKQGLQLRSETVATEGCDGVKLAYVRLLCVWYTIASGRLRTTDYRLGERQPSFLI